MLDESKKELEKIMNLYNKDLAALKQERDTELATQKNFRDQFEHIKHEVIWPMAAEIGNELTHYSHDFDVIEEEEYTDGTATFHPASLTLNIYPATLERYLKKPESAPYIKFMADTYAKKIKIMVSTMMPGVGGVIGEHGTYKIEDITPEFVEKEIIEVLKNIPVFHKV